MQIFSFVPIMKIPLAIVCVFVLGGLVHGATFFGNFPPEEAYCTDGGNIKIFPGEPYNSYAETENDPCVGMSCSRNRKTGWLTLHGTTCGVVGVEHPEYRMCRRGMVPGRYPDCCPQMICNDGDRTYNLTLR